MGLSVGFVVGFRVASVMAILSTVFLLMAAQM